MLDSNLKSKLSVEEVAVLENRFTKCFVAIAFQFNSIKAFRETSSDALSAHNDRTFQSMVRSMSELLADRTFYKDGHEVMHATQRNALATQGTQKVYETNASFIDNGCVVFAHSVWDIVTVDLLRILALVPLDEWHKEVGNKEVPLKEVLEKGLNVVVRERVAKFVREQERESVVTRMKALNRILKVPSEGVLEEWVYSDGLASKLDNLRHDIIHRKGPETRIPDCEIVIKDIENMCWHAFYAIHRIVGLQIDLNLHPEHF